jgi:hypothetical protein
MEAGFSPLKWDEGLTKTLKKNIHPNYYRDMKVDANQCYTVMHGLEFP